MAVDFLAREIGFEDSSWCRIPYNGSIKTKVIGFMGDSKLRHLVFQQNHRFYHG